MSLTLGEKLRQAREERGISISEVAEQTRISPHYLDSIENDDYRTLPGGIFNKGFVKSFAKAVGINEQEALQEYSRIISSQDSTADGDPKSYKPEVLTDDRTSSSMIPTVIFAVIILGLMTWGILTLVNYIQNQPSQQAAASPTPAQATNTNQPVNTTATTAPTPAGPVNEIKIDFKAADAVAVTATVDGKVANDNLAAEAVKTYVGQESVKLRYYRGFADRVKITVNGKEITPPAAPLKGVGIEFEVNKSNVGEILQSGQIVVGQAPPANTNTPR